MFKFLRLILLQLFLSSLLLAGVGGKLAGTIVSSGGDPLPGVNILIDGTELGAASGESGEYFILNIPPGRQTVRYMMIGRKTHVQQKVVIVADFTTTVDVVLEQISLNAEEEVMVTAERPLIQRDATSTVKVVDAETIVDMPVVDFKDVLVTQAGFTTDASGGIHVRGGRTKEILYMIDGIVVKDPLLGDFSGSVNQNAIQQMTVISGTFNAEYGQAMSSVVNIVTKEGGGKFHGKFEHISSRINESPYHSAEAFDDVTDTNYVWQDLGPSLYDYLSDNLLVSENSPLIPLSNIDVNGSVSLNLGGRLPVINTDFFMSGFYGSNDSYLPHGSDVNQDVQIKLTRRLTPK
ncbi:MAG TPA: TonB-dependent receptor, partial [Candidatus Marinimicrobia bacterium]|nr:TonB-dependent receptor [Candidatus Neomarinimicrobiota bacterium]